MTDFSTAKIVESSVAEWDKREAAGLNLEPFILRKSGKRDSWRDYRSGGLFCEQTGEMATSNAILMISGFWCRS